MHRRGVDREVDARDRRERRREAVHVVEQVERVRDPDEPEERDRDAEHVVRDELDAQTRRRSRSRRRRTARRASRRGLRWRMSSTRPGERRAIAQPARIPASSQVGSTAPTASASSDAGGEAGGDRRRPRTSASRASCQRSPVGCATSWARSGRGAQQGPQGERRDGQGGDRDDRFHGGGKGSGRPGSAPILSALVRAPAISGATTPLGLLPDPRADRAGRRATRAPAGRGRRDRRRARHLGRRRPRAPAGGGCGRARALPVRRPGRPAGRLDPLALHAATGSSGSTTTRFPRPRSSTRCGT